MRLKWGVALGLVGLMGCAQDGASAVEDDSAVDAAVADAQIEDAAVDPCAALECAADEVCVAGRCEPGALPQVEVSPESLEFGPVRVDTTEVRVVTLTNPGAGAVRIVDVHLEGSVGFTLEALDLPIELAAGAQLEWAVAYAPTDPGADAGTLVIGLDGAAQPVAEVALRGEGAMNACPVAVGGPALVAAVPGDVVELDASASTDPDGRMGQPQDFLWLVIERPDGSTAQPVERYQDPRRPADTGLADDPSTPRALFLADLAGVYTLELRVIDAEGLEAPSEACPQPPVQVRIEVFPEADVHVQLTWNTPGDPDQTDERGTDLDLHFRHPRGEAWGHEEPFDCYFANSHPDWGGVGLDGSPRMTRDDVNGAGPETILFDAPEHTPADGPYYRVAVEYFRAEGAPNGGSWGPSEATVRVMLRGEPVAEFVKVLESTGDFWEVADIVWDGEARRVIGLP